MNAPSPDRPRPHGAHAEPASSADAGRRSFLQGSAALLAACGAGVPLLSACGGGGGLSPSHARALNLYLDSPRGVSYVVEGNTLAASVAFEAASAYADVPGGSRATTMTDLASGATLVSGSNLYFKDKYHVQLVAGAEGVAGNKFLTDADSRPDGNNVRLRFINMAVRGLIVDVYITAPDADLASATATLTGVAVNVSSLLFDRAAGNLRIRITPYLKKDALVYDSGGISLAAGQSATLVLYSAGSGELSSLYAIYDSTWAGNSRVLPNALARLRYLHGAALAADAGLRVSDNGQARAAAVAARSFTGFETVAAGAHALAFADAGSGAALGSVAVTVAAARDYTLLSSGGAAGVPTAFTLVEERTIAPSAGKCKLRVLNASADRASASVAVAGVRRFDAVAGGGAAGAVELDPGTYDFTARFAGDAADTALGPLTLEADRAYTLALFGSARDRGAFLQRD
jgi:hypothetical protein